MRWWRSRSLQVQLAITVVALGAAALAVSGAVAVAALRTYLVGQVDDQLLQVATGPGPMGPGTGGERLNDDHGPGAERLPAEFYVQYESSAGAVTVLARPRTGGTPELPAVGAEQTPTSEPFTVPGSDGAQSWRVIQQPAEDGVLSWAKPMGEIDETLSRLVMLELVVGLAVLAALAVAATIVVRRNLRPLVQVEHTATAIAGGDLSRRVPPGVPKTEVGQLSAAVNTMLDAISANMLQRDQALAESQASEARMRRFVADASHELRTPLTSIRGYSELYRQGAISADDVARAFARVEGESERMAGLVDDLLLLARLDEQRPLERAPVDLLELANDVVHSARAAHPGRSIRLTATGDAVPVVAGDAARLRQVVANLVGNALKYTSGAVTIGVESRPGWVALAVADEGPGIAAADRARVFERFYRGDASRSSGGTGLGLSIVAAIVKAHGGTVAVRDRPGGGAVFDVALPTGA